jgi:hypothetical protein
MRNVRKDLIALSLGFVVSLASGCITTPKVSGFEFPVEITGAKNVEPYPVDGAKRGLVHLRTTHYVPPIAGEMISKAMGKTPKEFYAHINEVQSDVGLILRDLHGRGLVDEIYSEFVTLDQPVHCSEDVYESHRRRMRELYGTGFIPNQDVLSESEAIEESENVGGAEFVFALDQGIELKSTMPFSEEELRDKIKGKSYRERAGRLREFREDTLLDIGSSTNGNWVIAPYGGGHDFTDNIERWNASHPESMYSLYVITPESYVPARDLILSRTSE